jgi:tetratricopeptide (TPR) repeat protein
MRESLIWNELGNLYLKVEAFDEAITAFQQAIELNPDSGWCYVSLGHAYSKKGDHEKALALYHKSIALVKDERQKAVLWNRLGDSYRARRDFEQAMAAYKMADDIEAHGFQPASAGSGHGIETFKTITAASVWPAGHPQGAQPAAPRSAEAPVRSAPARRSSLPQNNYAMLAVPQETASAGAQKSFYLPPVIQTEVPLEDEPELDERYQIKAHGLHVFVADPTPEPPTQPLKQVVEAAEPAPAPAAAAPHRPVSERHEREIAEIRTKIEIYEKISAINPTNDRAWDTLGKLYKSIGRYDQASAAFERAIAVCPNREAYYYHLGLVHSVEKKLDRAIWAFENVIRICPEYVLAHGALAGIYRRMGQEAKANNHISIALPLMDSESAYNRACFHSICGNHDQAFELLQQALDNHDTTIEWIESDPDLDLLRSDPRYAALIRQKDSVRVAAGGEPFADEQTRPGRSAVRANNVSPVR